MPSFPCGLQSFVRVTLEQMDPEEYLEVLVLRAGNEVVLRERLNLLNR